MDWFFWKVESMLKQLLSLRCLSFCSQQYCLLEAQTFTLVLLHPTSRRWVRSPWSVTAPERSLGADEYEEEVWEHWASLTAAVVLNQPLMMSSPHTLCWCHQQTVSPSKSFLCSICLRVASSVNVCTKFEEFSQNQLHTCYCNIVTFLSCLSTFSQSQKLWFKLW